MNTTVGFWTPFPRYFLCICNGTTSMTSRIIFNQAVFMSFIDYAFHSSNQIKNVISLVEVNQAIFACPMIFLFE